MESDEDPSTTESSIERQTVSSGGWMLLNRGVVRTVGLIQTVIVARLLSPEAFGIFGLTLLLLSVLEHFTEAGLSEAIIQRTDNVDSYLDVAWTAQLLRGGLITLVLTIAAPWAAQFFAEPLLATFLPLAGVIVFIGSLRNIGIVYFRKELNFFREFLYRTSGPVVAFPLVVGTAYYTRSVWALMIMLFAEKLTETVLSYFLHSYRPAFRLDVPELHDLFGFGRWILGSKILKFSLLEGDDLFVGKFLGSHALGIYQLAYRFSQMPVKEFCNSINKVLFPAFSKLQKNPEDLRRTWLDSLTLVSFLAFPMSLGIFCVAPEAVRVILGTDWLGMIVPIRILSLLGLIRSINYDSVFKATNNPDWITKLASIRLAVMVITIVPLTARWGVSGTAVCVLLAALAVEPLALSKVLTVLDLRYRQFARALWVPLVATGVMVSFLMVVRIQLPVLSPVGVAGEILAGASTYFFVVFTLSYVVETKLVKLVRGVLSTLAGGRN